MIEFRAQNGIANLYGIKQTDLPIYLYFNVVMIFFRPIGDVFNLSQLELFHGWKVYEYLVYSRYRFLQREMRWKVGWLCTPVQTVSIMYYIYIRICV